MSALLRVVEPCPKCFLYTIGPDAFEVCYRDPLLDEPVRIRLPRSDYAKAFQRYPSSSVRSLVAPDQGL